MARAFDTKPHLAMLGQGEAGGLTARSDPAFLVGAVDCVQCSSKACSTQKSQPNELFACSPAQRQDSGATAEPRPHPLTHKKLSVDGCARCKEHFRLPQHLGTTRHSCYVRLHLSGLLGQERAAPGESGRRLLQWLWRGAASGAFARREGFSVGPN